MRTIFPVELLCKACALENDSFPFILIGADIMSGDRQLANEIEFDLRRFEEQQQEAERQQRRASQGAPLIQVSVTTVEQGPCGQKILHR